MEFEIIKTTDLSHFKMGAKWMASSDPWKKLELNEDACLNAFEGDYREVYFLKVKGEFLGFVILQHKGSFKGYIQTICIHPEARGKGYGTAILQFSESLISNYSPNIFICVSSFNTNALKLYLQFGFEVVGELPNFVKQGFIEILLRKTSGPIHGYSAKNK